MITYRSSPPINAIASWYFGKTECDTHTCFLRMEWLIMLMDRSIGNIGTIPFSRPWCWGEVETRNGRNKTRVQHIQTIYYYKKSWALERLIKLTFWVNNMIILLAVPRHIYQTQNTANNYYYHARHFSWVQKRSCKGTLTFNKCDCGLALPITAASWQCDVLLLPSDERLTLPR
jgi:hypothetical protein